MKLPMAARAVPFRPKVKIYRRTPRNIQSYIVKKGNTKYRQEKPAEKGYEAGKKK